MQGELLISEKNQFPLLTTTLNNFCYVMVKLRADLISERNIDAYLTHHLHISNSFLMLNYSARMHQTLISHK